MIAGFTGHRYLNGKLPTLTQMERLEDMIVAILKRDRPDQVISGMAIGFDTAVARAAIKIEVPLIAAVPFQGQHIKWPSHVQLEYHGMLEKATKVVVVSEGFYSARKLQIRNEWIVDNSDILYALWDGGNSGTGNCVRYADGKVKIINLWQCWNKYN